MKNQFIVHFWSVFGYEEDIEAKDLAACYKKLLKKHPVDFVDFNSATYWIDGEFKILYYIDWTEWL